MASNQPYNPFPPAPAAAAPFAPVPGNGLAIAGMVVGIVGLVFCWIPYAGAVIALVGLALSIPGLLRGRRIGKGTGMAIAGLICSIGGIICGAYVTYLVATAFDKYVGKSRALEGVLQVSRIGRSVTDYYETNSALPPSAVRLPADADTACGEPGHRFPAVTTWAGDPGWSALDFQLEEPSPFSYRYTKLDETTGLIEASGDADCDGDITRFTGRVIVRNGQAAFRMDGEDERE